MAIDLFPSGGGGGGGLKSVQTGFISTTTLSVGTGEDLRYVDVPITPVSDITKCDVVFVGSGTDNNGAGQSMVLSSGQAYTMACALYAPRLTSTSNLRLASAASVQTNIAGRWYVKEYE